MAVVLLLLLAPLAWAQAGVAIPPLDGPVVDTTGTLDAAQRRHLEQQALALQRRKGSQLQVLMVASTQPESIEAYTQRVFDAWKLGRAGIDDAVLVVVAKDDRRVRIQPGYGLEGAIPDVTAGRVIQEYMAPRFREGDYGGGLVDATAAIVRLVDGEPLPAALAEYRGGDAGEGRRAAMGTGTRSRDWAFALVAGFVVAGVARRMSTPLPVVLRGVFTGGAAGWTVWLLSALGGLSAAVAVMAFLFGLARAPAGAFARGGGWGGFGGGGWGGSSGGGGGWSGGGGSSGGGGASGSW
ncbi:MAG TPA: TPM domain-containing protein [Luteimonas sp.]|nr:TPM domain-containing protein [Luteimonas sp.]